VTFAAIVMLVLGLTGYLLVAAFSTPELPEMAGARGFCGDSAGRMCMSSGGTPPVRDGRCDPCKKLQ
jgi:hypothetical protein